MRDDWTPKKRGLQVEVKGGNLEGALKVLKKRMASEGVFRDMRRQEAYEKPSEQRRRKAEEAVRRHRKAVAKKRKSD